MDIIEFKVLDIMSDRVPLRVAKAKLTMQIADALGVGAFGFINTYDKLKQAIFRANIASHRKIRVDIKERTAVLIT